MAKEKKLSKIEITNVETGQVLPYMVRGNPNKTTVGNTVFGPLNSIGFAELQALGHQVYDEKDWCKLIREKLGLSEAAVGKRGSDWSTIESREKLKVTVDGLSFNPPLKSSGEVPVESDIMPTPASIPSVMANVAPVKKATVISPKAKDAPIKNEQEVISQIHAYLEKGVSEDKIIGALTGQVGQKRADVLFKMATAPVVAQPPTEAPLDFTF